MRTKRGTVISGLPRLYPVSITSKTTGEVLTWDGYSARALAPLLEWVHNEAQRLYDQDTDRAHALAAQLKGSANSHARMNGYKAGHMALPREVKAKSRLAELVYYKLMAETASYEKNPNPHKRKHSFSSSVNLGAVNQQMCILERDGNYLILSWKCWDDEYELVFLLPKYVLSRTITKFSLPVVSGRGFVFSTQETPTPISGGRVAGLDLGRVEPYTLTVLSSRNKLLAQYTASPRLKRTNQKRERILREVTTTRSRAHAREALGLDATKYRAHVRALRNKATRLGVTVAAEMGSEVAKHVTRHEVAILRVENLAWAHGAKYGSKWNHGSARAALTHATARVGAKTQAVNPRGTSQHCHKCRAEITHRTKTRTVWCGDCKSVLDRDVNAALNISKNQSYPPVAFYGRGGHSASHAHGVGFRPESSLLDAL